MICLFAALCVWLLAMAFAATPSCTTSGPATLQYKAARVGGQILQREEGVTNPAACAAACCGAAGKVPCRSWTFSDGQCELLGLYSSMQANASATSGVVYRPEVQSEPWSNLRGFNYVPPQNVNDIDMWRDYNRTVVERDMAIAQQTGFNFARVFLNFHVWDAQRDAFIGNVKHFLSTAHAHGIDVMPIAFDLCWFGCRNESVSVASSGKCWYPSPQFSLADSKDWWSSKGEAYVDALVSAFPVGTPGLLLWDVVNEPESGGRSGLPGETGVRWEFVRHFVQYFHSKSATPTTVGVGSVESLEHVADVVDVLSFHSYHATWELGLQRTETALNYARRYGKPVFNSETGCIARANAFDQTMEMCARNGMGFVIWELMISDCLDCIDTRRWKHGLMYTDGSTRDASAIAALHGVYVNRGDEVAIAVPRADVEGASSRTVAGIHDWLAKNASADFLAGVQLLDELSNLVESSLVVPLVLPPSGEARHLAAVGESPETRRRLAEVLAAQVVPLAVTKMGKETAPGSCTFEGTMDRNTDGLTV